MNVPNHRYSHMSTSPFTFLPENKKAEKKSKKSECSVSKEINDERQTDRWTERRKETFILKVHFSKVVTLSDTAV